MTKLHSLEPLEARIAPAVAVFELSSLNGFNGFKLSGAASGDLSGRSVSDAGDVNGDGFDDLIIGAHFAYANGVASGASYVIFGKATGFAADLKLSTLDGSNGFRISGAARLDFSGRSVSAAGDVNGDGFGDVIIGNGSDSGTSYVVFGKASVFAPDLNLSTLDGSNGFKLSGPPAGSVSCAGDVNGDGFGDVIIGAPYADSNGSNFGASYVIFGKAAAFAANLDVSTLDGRNGFKVIGVAAYDKFGAPVSAAGDVNGDGFDDLIIGAYSASPNGNESGASYVVFGNASGFAAELAISTLDGSNGFKLSGVAQYDRSGSSVSTAGDVNGDGFGDLFIGAPQAGANGFGSGASYVVFGKATGFGANLNLSTLDGSNGFKLSAAPGGRSGVSLSNAGDVNGDGFGDVIIGAPRSDSTAYNSGASYVVFGKASGFAANIDLSTLNGLHGFKLSGVARDDYSGSSVSGAGDVNGDGFGDVIIGAFAADPNGSSSGASYVVFGSALGPFASMSISDVNITEPVSGTAIASFTVTLSSQSAQTVTVHYATADGTANAPDDYTAVSGATLIFAPGEISKEVLIPINTNSPIEPNETFFVNLSNPTNATLIDAEGVATILDETGAFQLSSLNGLNGFKLSGVAFNDFSGRSVSDAGDVNGDGFDDVIIGADRADLDGARDAGTSYVIFGQATGFPADLNLSTLDGSNGFRITGASKYDRSGSSVSAAGDVNGDGFGDVIIGADQADPYGFSSGASYVVFGKQSGFSPNVNLSTLDGSNGFKLSGAANTASTAGDVNGDGFDDLIIGASGASLNGTTFGASYVVFGKPGGFSPNLYLSTLDGSNGFTLRGAAASEGFGYSVSTAGDVNGDGFDDLIIGAPGASSNGIASGASYVVFGKASGFVADLPVSTLDGSNGFRLRGVTLNERSGGSVSAAGDVNGDGFGDVIIGAPQSDPGAIRRSFSGATYLVFGKASGFAANLNLSTLDGNNGFKLSGSSEERSASSVSNAGDVNGDGFDDLIIGAPESDSSAYNSGVSYLVFGKASGFVAHINLSDLDGNNGFQLNGVAERDFSGGSVSAAGDVNGDGFGDILIGASGADPNGFNSGASYVVFGHGLPLPSVSIGDATALEGDAGTSSILFPVTLSSASALTVQLHFSTANGTAVAGSDYKPQFDQTFEFAPGETTKMIRISLLGDTALELDETFLINLSNPTNATLADAQGQGTILNDDAVPLVISPDGHRATFPDLDGDLVTVTTTKGAFVLTNFFFDPLGQLLAIDLAASSDPGAFTGAKITAFAQTAGGGDGLVNVPAFKALGINLKKVTIDGDLGEIDVGTGGPGNMALRKLIANSMELGAGTESTFAGSVGAIRIAHDVKAVLNIKGGPGSAGIDVVGQVVIGGSLDGSAGGAAAGLLQASGGIGRIVVKESVIGGAEQCGIVVGGSLGVVTIGGDLRSADPARPVTISALGDLSATDAEHAVALSRVTVGGSVLNAEILAGYRRDGTPFNPDAGIGRIAVAGNWSASSAAAGVADSTGDGFGRNDTLIAGDTTPRLFARIASITIAGTATGSAAAGDHFGISAQQIGRVTVANKTRTFTAGPDNVLLDPEHLDFRAVDLA